MVLHRKRAVSHVLSGYAYTTSQYGLAIDNIAGYELVLPNGTVFSVTSKDEDLWFGLRVRRKVRYMSVCLKCHHSQGGMNNFVRFPCFPLLSRAHFMAVDILIGDCDQIHFQVVSSKRHMGKLAIMVDKSHCILTHSSVGGLPFLLRRPAGRDQNGAAQFSRDE